MKKEDAQNHSKTKCRCLSEEVGTREEDRQDTVREEFFRRRVVSTWEQRPAAKEINQDRDS